jgi:hypothetical protein
MKLTSIHKVSRNSADDRANAGADWFPSVPAVGSPDPERMIGLRPAQHEPRDPGSAGNSKRPRVRLER